MSVPHENVFRRTDIWREGKWVDLWSVVHLLSGASVGLALYFVHFEAAASITLALVSFTAYELWEAMVDIKETPTNRFMDVVTGMASFLPVFLLAAPRLSGAMFWWVFGIVLAINIVLAIFGWIASQKAAELEQRVRAKVEREKVRVRQRTAKVRRALKGKEEGNSL